MARVSTHFRTNDCAPRRGRTTGWCRAPHAGGTTCAAAARTRRARYVLRAPAARRRRPVPRRVRRGRSVVRSRCRRAGNSRFRGAPAGRAGGGEAGGGAGGGGGGDLPALVAASRVAEGLVVVTSRSLLASGTADPKT